MSLGNHEECPLLRLSLSEDQDIARALARTMLFTGIESGDDRLNASHDAEAIRRFWGLVEQLPQSEGKLSPASQLVLDAAEQCARNVWASQEATMPPITVIGKEALVAHYGICPDKDMW